MRAIQPRPPSHDGIGYANDFTRRSTTFMAWELTHLARLLKDAGGVPAHGNQPRAWDAGCRFGPPRLTRRGSEPRLCRLRFPGPRDAGNRRGGSSAPPGPGPTWIAAA